MPNNFKTNTLAVNIMNDFVAKLTFNNHSVTSYNNINTENGIINFSKKVQADLIANTIHRLIGQPH